MQRFALKTSSHLQIVVRFPQQLPRGFDALPMMQSFVHATETHGGGSTDGLLVERVRRTTIIFCPPSTRYSYCRFGFKI